MKPLRNIPFYLLALILACALGIHAQQTQAPPAAAPPAAAPPAAGQDMQETVTVEDVARTFVVHLPKTYDSKKNIRSCWFCMMLITTRST